MNNYESVFDNDSVRVKLEKHPVHGAAISLDLMEDGEQTAGTTIYLGQEQIDGMAAWLDKLRTARPEELLRIGYQMSNLCYNCAQMDDLPEHVRKPMRELREQWDAACDMNSGDAASSAAKDDAK